MRRSRPVPFLALLPVAASAVSATPAAPVAAAAPPASCDLPAGCDEGPPDPLASLHPVGTLRAVMLFVDFPDAPASGSTDACASLLLPARGWCERASHGRFTLRIDPVADRPRLASMLTGGEPGAAARGNAVELAIAAGRPGSSG